MPTWVSAVWRSLPGYGKTTVVVGVTAVVALLIYTLGVDNLMIILRWVGEWIR